MFKYGCIARHQCRGRETNDLPEGVVPGHQGQHNAERLERNVALSGTGLNVFIVEELLSIICVIVAVPGALLDFSLSLSDWFAHFQRSDLSQVGFVAAQMLCHTV